jgi:hypothetical protein
MTDNNDTVLCVNGRLEAEDLVLSLSNCDYSYLLGRVVSVGGDGVSVDFTFQTHSKNRQKVIDGLGRDTVVPPGTLLRVTDISHIDEICILNQTEYAKAYCESELEKLGITELPAAPPELEMKLYSRLNFYLLYSNPDDDSELIKLSHETVSKYPDAIETLIEYDRDCMDSTLGLANSLEGTLEGKVVSMFPSIEFHSGRYWYVTTAKLNELLSQNEIMQLKIALETELDFRIDVALDVEHHNEVELDEGSLCIDPFPEYSEDCDDFIISTEREFREMLGLDGIEVPDKQAKAEPMSLTEALRAAPEPSANPTPKRGRGEER